MEYWTATYYIDTDMGVTTFGNLNGRIFTSEEDAWDEILKDMCGEIDINKNCIVDCNHENNYAMLTNVREKRTIRWEVQKMFIDND